MRWSENTILYRERIALSRNLWSVDRVIAYTVPHWTPSGPHCVLMTSCQLAVELRTQYFEHDRQLMQGRIDLLHTRGRYIFSNIGKSLLFLINFLYKSESIPVLRSAAGLTSNALMSSEHRLNLFLRAFQCIKPASMSAMCLAFKHFCYNRIWKHGLKYLRLCMSAKISRN